MNDEPKFGEVWRDATDDETVMILAPSTDGDAWWILILANPGGTIESGHTTTRHLDVSGWRRVDAAE